MISKIRSLLLPLGIAVSLAGSLSGAARAAPPDLAAAQTLVEEHSKLPSFTPPGAPFDAPACMKGKKILTMPVSSANPLTKNIAPP